MYGVKEAKYVQEKIRQLGIQDVQLFFDTRLSMWCICQVAGRSSSLILPDSYTPDLKPSIMWWIKDQTGRRRLPSEQDVSDIIAVRQRAEKIWASKEGALADELDKQSAEKDRKHREKLKDKIHTIAPAMKKALREGNL